LVRNERYWGVRPAFDRLVYYQVKDDVAEETMYRNRQLDRFAGTPEQYERLKNDPSITGRSTSWEYYSPVGGYSFIGWNQMRGGKPTFFADKRIRQAMTMLIDRQRLAQELYLGHATPATGPFGYGSPQADPTIQPWPFDPARARQLLQEAGFEDRNGDGVIERAGDGKPFEFALTYGSGNPFIDRIVLFVKDQLAQAGIKLNLDPVDWPIQLKKLDTRDFDASILGWSTSIETDCNQIFHSSQTKDNGDNFVNYINPELDRAIEKARSTVDEQQRMQAWRVVHRIIHEDQPYTFLLNRQACVFIDHRIKNIRKTRMGLNMVLTELMPLPWYVPRELQLHSGE
jgi:peptide/nickel transport system substrate-binding protein